MTEKLQHIAFIMDGNRRWAKARGLPIIAGHEKGAKTLTEVVKAAKDLGFNSLSEARKHYNI